MFTGSSGCSRFGFDFQTLKTFIFYKNLLRFLIGFSLCFGESWGFVGNPWTYMGLRGLSVKEARYHVVLTPDKRARLLETPREL